MKRSLWCLLAFLCCGVEGWGAAAWVGGAGTCTGSASSIAVTYSPAAGNTIIAAYTEDASFNGSLTSITASDTTALTSDSDVNVDFHDNRWFTWRRYSNIPSGLTSFTANLTGARAGCLLIGEISGLTTSSPLDVADTTGAQDAFGTTWHAGAITTTNANDIVLGAAFDGFSTISGTGSWSNGVQVSTGGRSGTMVYQVVSSAGSYQPQGTASGADQTSGNAISYKASGGGSPPKSVIVGGGIQ